MLSTIKSGHNIFQIDDEKWMDGTPPNVLHNYLFFIAKIKSPYSVQDMAMDWR